jgi:hypothetical protein
MQFLELSEHLQPRVVVLAHDPSKCERFGEKIMRACQ